MRMVVLDYCGGCVCVCDCLTVFFVCVLCVYVCVL